MTENFFIGPMLDESPDTESDRNYKTY